MSIVYLVALAAVCVILLAVMADAVRAVSRKPVWHSAQMPRLQQVETVDRRTQTLPFVGTERRQAENATVHTEAQDLRKVG